MILKKLQRTNLSKTKAAMIGGLVDYVLAQKDEEGKQKRLYAYGMNFLTTTTAAWKQEMIALSEESIKSRMPVSHWAMSWQENEIPSHEQVQEAVNIFLERMGLKGHQAIVAAHGNTGNFHIHIVVNRTHPYTEKVIQPHRGFDIEAAHRIVAEIEHKQGWASQDHARYRVNEKGEIVRNRQLKQVKPDSRAEDFENATGEKSAQRIAQERGHAIIANARTWKDLHEGLTRAGLRFKKKGSGAVVFVGEIEVKLSSVDRKFGFANLCKRLGEYEEGEYPEEAPKMEPEPVRHVCVEEWREYQKEREEASEERRVVRRREAENMRQEKERQHARRDSALAALARHELSVLNIARHCLKKQEEETAQARQNLPPRKIPPVRRFKHWLGKRSPRLASLWRFRRRITPDMRVRPFEFPRTGALAAPFPAYREMVKRRFSDMHLARSRLDYMTALYLRCAGYTKAEVSEELSRHSPAPSTLREKNIKVFYDHRIVGQAFGVAGDIDIASVQPNLEQIQKLNREAEEMERERIRHERRERQVRSTFRLR
ncbi:relaxase/mobilization nuclease domain-containing protein [uncultured Bilophila sp.]|uniref:relaxase/mobilization nuclease domain-containing protein n=2 Tax=uncultured Bilophila sp. TaxID=529385 RepID=UPI0026366883|nr:relaxase/mobilization nuclease domain-containing protein [uncultured Bilophila sp.]